MKPSLTDRCTGSCVRDSFVARILQRITCLIIEAFFQRSFNSTKSRQFPPSPSYPHGARLPHNSHIIAHAIALHRCHSLFLAYAMVFKANIFCTCSCFHPSRTSPIGLPSEISKIDERCKSCTPLPSDIVAAVRRLSDFLVLASVFCRTSTPAT